MYLIRFGRVAIFVQESRKLTKMGMSRSAIETPSDDAWMALCLKDPYAQCRKMDWFQPAKKNMMPGYVTSYAKAAPEAMAEIAAWERDKKLEDLMKK